MTRLPANMRSHWKAVRFYEPARRVVHEWPTEVKKELGAVLTRLQKEESVGMPDMRPVPSVAVGVAEIRLASKVGTFRTLHVIHGDFGVLAFHAFMKRTRETPEREKTVARTRLRKFLEEIEEER